MQLSVKDKVFAAAEQLAMSKAFDQITFAEVAQAAGVHWTAVRRHFGSKEAMRQWFKEKQADQHAFDQADTRSRVILAAEAVFAVQGYANSSLDKVAEHAGLSKGAVYWHFSSKQDLFLNVLERAYERQIRMLPAQMEHILAAADPMAELVVWLEQQFLCLEDGDERSKLFLQFLVSGQEPEIQQKLQLLHTAFLDKVGGFLQQLQQRGFLSDDIRPRALAAMLDSLLKGVLIEWLIDPDPQALRMLIETVSRTLWKGVAVK